MKNKNFQYTGRSLFEVQDKPLKVEVYIFALAMVISLLALVN